MSDVALSQEEINALLGGMGVEDTHIEVDEEHLSEVQIDTIGEIGNISMGTAATTLFRLINTKVLITAPKVRTIGLQEFKDSIEIPLVAISVNYTVGLNGSNLLVLSTDDVKIITDLMMGGKGDITDEPINAIHLSAIAEAMNQMVGSASTSLSQIFNKKIDISPPQALEITGDSQLIDALLPNSNDIVIVSFRLQIGDLIDGELMQILPVDFAKELAKNAITNYSAEENGGANQPMVDKTLAELDIEITEKNNKPMVNNSSNIRLDMEEHNRGYNNNSQPVQNNYNSAVNNNTVVQTAQFPSFGEDTRFSGTNGNIDTLMDISLEVTVELGKTKKKVKEILDFGPGTVVELNRLVGEPIDLLVNGKYIAKGEVVVIDENFGLRITDIIKPENRI